MSVIARGICAGLAADKSPFAINADVVLVAKVGHRDIDQTSILLALFGRPGPGILDGPACLRVFLRGLGRIVRPDIRRAFACLGPLFFFPGHPLARGGHQSRVYDLPTGGFVTTCAELVFKCREEFLERTGLRQLLPKQPDRLLVRGGFADPEP